MKQLRQRFFVQVGADHAQAAGIVGAAFADIDLAGYVVKLEPAARGVLQDTLGPQHLAVFLLVGELLQHAADLVLLIPLRGLQADVAEHLVRVVLVRAVVMVVMVMFVAVLVMMFMVMLMMVFMLIFIIIVVVIVVVMVMMPVLVLILVVIIVISCSSSSSP